MRFKEILIFLLTNVISYGDLGLSNKILKAEKKSLVWIILPRSFQGRLQMNFLFKSALHKYIICKKSTKRILSTKLVTYLSLQRNILHISAHMVGKCDFIWVNILFVFYTCDLFIVKAVVIDNSNMTSFKRFESKPVVKKYISTPTVIYDVIDNL